MTRNAAIKGWVHLWETGAGWMARGERIKRGETQEFGPYATKDEADRAATRWVMR